VARGPVRAGAGLNPDDGHAEYEEPAIPSIATRLKGNAFRLLLRLAPFVSWFPMSRQALRADAIAGLTVAMVLIPQSMAYAQLAGLPAYYGLYAAFLPVIVGALWGSSQQLSTGPVAMVSLLTGSALARFAAPGTEQFITYAIMLALMVGVMQFVMGLFRLGAIINFLSHPVIVGFTNAAAIIIALSQLNKLLGVPMARTDVFLLDIWGVITQLAHIHIPTLVMGTVSLAVILVLRRYRPQWPGVLIAVALATIVSWATGFEDNASADVRQFHDASVRAVIEYVTATSRRVGELQQELDAKAVESSRLRQEFPEGHPRVIALAFDSEILRLDIRTIEREHRLRLRELRQFAFYRTTDATGTARYYLQEELPAGIADGESGWRMIGLDNERLQMAGGGEVIGRVPAGLPALAAPHAGWDTIIMLMSTALVITLVGFMEAISIAKAMATRTRQRIDPNRELVGQGVANIVGSFFQSFPVSGSFSRSAVNLAAGAVTGMASVVAGVIVLVTLLLFTPLLYHLPQAVLAAIIMAAVLNLVNFPALKHAWQAHRHDGVAAGVTFVATLGFAPHLDTGVLAGAGLAIILYLYRTMKPRVAVLGRHPDGTLRDATAHGLQTSEHIIALRFDGSLYFANVPYFEDAVLDQVARNPRAKFILVVGDGINEMDGSGEETVRHLAERLRQRGVTMVFSGLKRQVLEVMEKTGLYTVIGAQNFFRTEDVALDTLYQWIGDPDFDARFCPLNSAAADQPR